ncbi:hypothetical protein GH714_030777 [Hevea brasiliensis]|uniref:Uncharacterized protein n=1 Tax=Hevea brasiliensis TaxID=3981 RepID=A0A6A6LPF1_HEVBR|nr:hypothetical protein GH714_030777 [Hevea brasiliensis]
MRWFYKGEAATFERGWLEIWMNREVAFRVRYIKKHTMGVNLPGVLAKQIFRQSLLPARKASPTSLDVPKGFIAVYVGEAQKKRFLVPVSYLNQPSFQDLLSLTEEEFGFNHPMGGLTIPCRLDTCNAVILYLNRS